MNSPSSKLKSHMQYLLREAKHWDAMGANGCIQERDELSLCI